MKNRKPFFPVVAKSKNQTSRRKAKSNSQPTYEALEARRVMALLIGSAPEYDGVFDPSTSAGGATGTGMGGFSSPGTGDGGIDETPPITGSLGDVSAPSELTDRFKIPELGQWPNAPTVTAYGLDELDAEPDGISLEQLPENHIIPTIDTADIVARYDSRMSTIQSQYVSDQATADSLFDSAILSANLARNNVMNSAVASRDAAISGYTPEDVQALRDSLQSAETAYHAEVSRVNQQETDWLAARSQEFSDTLNAAIDAATEEYNERVAAARET